MNCCQLLESLLSYWICSPWLNDRELRLRICCSHFWVSELFRALIDRAGSCARVRKSIFSLLMVYSSRQICPCRGNKESQLLAVLAIACILKQTNYPRHDVSVPLTGPSTWVQERQSWFAWSLKALRYRGLDIKYSMFEEGQTTNDNRSISKNELK